MLCFDTKRYGDIGVFFGPFWRWDFEIYDVGDVTYTRRKCSAWDICRCLLSSLAIMGSKIYSVEILYYWYMKIIYRFILLLKVCVNISRTFSEFVFHNFFAWKSEFSERHLYAFPQIFGSIYEFNMRNRVLLRPLGKQAFIAYWNKSIGIEFAWWIESEK